MKGLACDFKISSGKFPLTEGPDKSSKDVWFFSVFDTFRPYNPDFGLNVRSLLQKPVSSLLIGRTLLYSAIKNGIEKGVSLVEVTNVDIGYNSSDRTQYKVKIEFSYKGNNNSEDTVIFV